MSVEARLPVDHREAQDRIFMDAALVQARSIPIRTWPNPPVGAVVVRDGKVIAAGAHHGPGTPHAEQAALAAAAADARGATLYLTLEPCNHAGKTPPCAPAVVEAGIRRVVVAMRDPNPTVAGGGLRLLREHGVEVTCGVRGAAALDLVWPFVVTENFRRPYLELKTAQSLDGRFAPAPEGRRPGSAPYLTGEAARREVHRRRCWMDAVLVGEQTARLDRPRLDTRLATAAEDGPRTAPLPGYVDTDLSLAEGIPADPFLVVAGSAAAASAAAERLRRRGGRILGVGEIDGHADPAAVVAALAQAGLHCIMLEGGPRLAAVFLAAGLVDRWCLFTAPVLLGQGVRWPDHPAPDSRFSLTRCEVCGPDTLAVYDRRRFATVLQEVTL